MLKTFKVVISLNEHQWQKVTIPKIKFLIYVKINYLIKMFDIILPNPDTRPEDKTWQKISRVDYKSMM